MHTEQNILNGEVASDSEANHSNRNTNERIEDVRRYFSNHSISPFDQVSWEIRACQLNDPGGQVIYAQEDVEAPSSWSQMATLVVASKYFYGQQGSLLREKSVRKLLMRVVTSIKGWGEKDNYFDSIDEVAIFSDELTSLFLQQRAAFNSPVWFNVGIHSRPQTSACFILSVDDSLNSLTHLQSIETNLFKFGSGTGTNFSTIRSKKESISGGGVASGPVSFMRALDAWAGIIKSGGKTRRAAKMMILNIDHPDIREFINCKLHEEKKAHALIKAGFDGNFAIRGGAYDSVCFQNANLSVRVTDDFMRAVEQRELFTTKNITNNQVEEKIDAYNLLVEISQATHQCGDPGIQFDTTINNWNTCARSGRISASNPCSEFMSLDNSACNLSSINLLKFLGEDGIFDLKGYQHTIDVMIRAQDILIDNSSYPVEKIGENAHRFRQLGLGYTNLGALLMNLGLPYDSDQGRAWAAVLTSIMTGQAYLTSAKLAKKLGAFEAWKINKVPMMTVIQNHFQATQKISPHHVPSTLCQAALSVWKEAISAGESFGFRNSQTTVLAPTGTISFMMDCDTTGIEPDLALIKFKRLSDGGMLTVANQSVKRALKSLRYTDEEISRIINHIEENGTIEGAEYIKAEHIDVFDCALKPNGGNRVIHYLGHLKMMAAVQPFLSGAISKTVNLPSETTPDEIIDIYIQSWKMGIKSVALYRDGSKKTQPLSTQNININDEAKSNKGEKIPAKRRALPAERNSITHRFTVAGLKGYLTVGLYENGEPGEIFLVVAKEGSTLSGVMDAFATAVSLSLQHGVPLKTLVRKFSHMRFEPAGFTDNRDIPIVKSIIDYIFRWMGMKFLSSEEQVNLGFIPKSNSELSEKILKNSEIEGHQSKLMQNTNLFIEDSPPCTNCGSGFMVRQGSCYVCLCCGTQGGCG